MAGRQWQGGGGPRRTCSAHHTQPPATATGELASGSSRYLARAVHARHGGAAAAAATRAVDTKGGSGVFKAWGGQSRALHPRAASAVVGLLGVRLAGMQLDGRAERSRLCFSQPLGSCSVS